MQKTAVIVASLTVLVVAGVAVAQDQGIQAIIGNVYLQNTTPGTEQVGHATIKGTFRAGQVFVQQASPVTIPVVGNSLAVGAGATVGGSFSAGQQSSTALRGTATSAVGPNFGVLGESRSSEGTGVKGKGGHAGVFAEGFYGLIAKGNYVGVRGETTSGTGVLAINNATPFTAPYPAALLAQAPNGVYAARFEGPVGLGTSSKKGDLLNIQNGGITIYNNQAGSAKAVVLGVHTNQTGYIRVQGPDPNNGYSGLDFLANRPGQGWVYVVNGANVATAGMYESDEGFGQIEAERKFFTQPDPSDLERTIVYCCLEGPEVAAYTRGTGRLVNGTARIELPEHFRNVCVEEGMTVQLTPLSPDSEGLCVVEKNLAGFTVRELRRGQGSYQFDWEFKALRKANKGFNVYRDWDEMLPRGVERDRAWQDRLDYAKKVYGFEPSPKRP